MLKAVRILAVLFAVVIIAFWFLMGAHLGWTQTAVAVPKIDPVTEIEFTEYQNGFVPGVDFLVGGLVSAAAVCALSLAAAKTKKK
jgi:hypothetical protein